jgi:hypothetical protein
MENNTATYTEKQAKAVEQVKAKASSQGAKPTPVGSETRLANGTAQLYFDSPDGKKTVMFSISNEGEVKSMLIR